MGQAEGRGGEGGVSGAGGLRPGGGCPTNRGAAILTAALSHRQTSSRATCPNFAHIRVASVNFVKNLLFSNFLRLLCASFVRSLAGTSISKENYKIIIIIILYLKKEQLFCQN